MDFLIQILQEAFSPVQLLAWVGAVLYVISYQKKSAKETIQYWVPADIFMTLHFWFMGAPFFMCFSIGGLIRSVIALKSSRKILIIYLIIYLLFIFCLMFFIEIGFKEIIAYIGTMFFSGAVLFKDHFFTHRIFAFGHQITWLFAYFYLGSYGGIAMMVFIFCSNVIGTARYFLTK